jgi:hypothetical protein
MWDPKDSDDGVKLKITGVLDFVHRAEFQRLGNATFRKLDFFPSSSEVKKRPTNF